MSVMRNSIHRLGRNFTLILYRGPLSTALLAHESASEMRSLTYRRVFVRRGYLASIRPSLLVDACVFTHVVSQRRLEMRGRNDRVLCFSYHSLLRLVLLVAHRYLWLLCLLQLRLGLFDGLCVLRFQYRLRDGRWRLDFALLDLERVVLNLDASCTSLLPLINSDLLCHK